MPLIVGPLLGDGALVKVAVGLSQMRLRWFRQSLRPVPPPVAADALVDTGAEVTCVDGSLIARLGLPFGGTTLANIPSQAGMMLQPTHDVSLTLLHPSGNPKDNLMLQSLDILELSLGVISFEVLLGRDVLDLCRFLYLGPQRRFFLKYP